MIATRLPLRQHEVVALRIFLDLAAAVIVILLAGFGMRAMQIYASGHCPTGGGQ